MSRICVDAVCSRRARSEVSYGHRLLEVIVAEDEGGAPDDHALLADWSARRWW